MVKFALAMVDRGQACIQLLIMAIITPDLAMVYHVQLCFGMVYHDQICIGYSRSWSRLLFQWPTLLQ